MEEHQNQRMYMYTCMQSVYSPHLVPLKVCALALSTSRQQQERRSDSPGCTAGTGRERLRLRFQAVFPPS